MKKRVDSRLIYSEQMMVEALHDTLDEENFGVFNQNSYRIVDLNVILPLWRKRIDYVLYVTKVD